MRDYRSWSKVSPRVTSLLLDTANPRIPRGRGIKEQRDLIAELVQHDHVYELARSITADGYFPVENLIAIEDDGKTIVVEGNRRLAALKLLINPDLAPEGMVSKFKSLSAQTSLDVIEKVTVVIAPNRTLAAPLIMQRHTRQQIERWSPLMQASFYRSLADSGTTLEDLAEQYGRPQSEIAEFLRIDMMYAIACSLEYPTEVGDVVRDPREFPSAVLQRILDVPKARDFLGIEFKDHVELSGKADLKQFKKAYGKIVTDIANGDVDTRTLNKVEDVENYLGKLSSYKPQKASGKAFNANDFDISVPSFAAGGKTKATPAKQKRHKHLTMIPAGVHCELKSQRIVDIFDELRKLRVDKFPNACAVMLRILLELSIGEYFEATNKIAPLLATAQAKKKGPDWYPTLRHFLNAALKDTEMTANLRTQARKKLNRLVSQADSVLSLDDLDGYVHNAYMHPTHRELVGLWEALEGLFEVILKQPPESPKKKK